MDRDDTDGGPGPGAEASLAPALCGGPAPPFVSFTARLGAVAQARGGAPAVLGPGPGLLSYADLWARATAFGETLRAAGAGRERLVGLCLDKSPAYVVAMLGVWCAGAAFLPLDPRMPAARLKEILADAGPCLVVASDGTTAPGVPLVAPPELGGSVPAPAPVAILDPGDLAYVIYTSGSSGAPKGVLVPHGGIVGFLDAQIAAFGLGPAARALWLLSPSFDASVSDVGTALLSGAALCIEPDDALRGPGLLAALTAHGVTHLDLPPSLLSVLEPERLPAALATLIIGGEVCAPAVVRRFAARRRVVNVYGPTEATVCTSLCACAPERWVLPLIGRPVPGARLYILDEGLRRVPAGTPGELYIGGAGLARGYLRRPALDAARFVWQGGERLYKSGDRVVQHGDGEIEFLGRVDRQVKLRGLLVEPEEIEARLRGLPGVAEAAVLLRESAPGRALLVAYVVAWTTGQQGPGVSPGAAASRGSAVGLAPAVLDAHLAQVLPRWMLPQRYELLAALPRTATGKVDLGALCRRPLPPPGGVAATSVDAPVELSPAEAAHDLVPAESALGAIWRAVLHRGELAPPGPVQQYAPQTDFVSLGGDSLAALEVSLLAAELGLSISPAALLSRRTLRELAAQAGADDARTCDQLAADPALHMTVVREETPRSMQPTPPAADTVSSGTPASPSEAPPAVQDVLLTGATGFLGARLLGELLRRTPAHVRCLVRAADEAAALARVRAALRAAGEDLGTPGRVSVLVGDVCAPRFGLGEARWAALAAEVDTIYHCAAAVHLLRGYDDLHAANVLAVREAVRLCQTGRAKRLHHASTLAVLLLCDPLPIGAGEGHVPGGAARLLSGYAQSKWAAEALVRGAAVDGGIYRLGLLTGDGHGVPRDDLLARCVRGLARLGCVPEEALGPAGDRLLLDATPVGYAAAALCQLSLRAGGVARTFHVANPAPLSLRRLVLALGAVGVGLRPVPRAVWQARLGGRDGAALALGLSRIFRPGAHALDLFLATAADLRQDQTRALLEEAGLRCPPADGPPLLRYLRDLLRDEPLGGRP